MQQFIYTEGLRVRHTWALGISTGLKLKWMVWVRTHSGHIPGHKLTDRTSRGLEGTTAIRYIGIAHGGLYVLIRWYTARPSVTTSIYWIQSLRTVFTAGTILALSTLQASFRDTIIILHIQVRACVGVRAKSEEASDKLARFNRYSVATDKRHSLWLSNFDILGVCCGAGDRNRSITDTHLVVL